MAVLNGKLYFSWVQRPHLCIPEAIKQALSHWPLAISKARTLSSALLHAFCGKSASRLRRGKAGRP